MTDYEDYKNNLSSSQEGDWADTEPKNNTDRTASTIELINKIEELNKWLDLKSEYIEKLEKKLEIAITGLYDIAENGETRWDMNQAKWYLDHGRELDK